MENYLLPCINFYKILHRILLCKGKINILKNDTVSVVENCVNNYGRYR